mgnify:FL=1
MDSEHMMNCLRQMRFIARYMSLRHREAEILMKMEVKHNARTNGKTKE